MLAAALVIVGLARPILDTGRDLSGTGPLLLVIDDGWASAADWPLRLASAQAALDRADRAGRRGALLTTAASEDGTAPTLTAEMPIADLRARLSALRPKPWPTDRAAATAALARATGTVIYLADGVAGGEGFEAKLATIGAVEELRDPEPPVLMLPPTSLPDRLVAQIVTLPAPAPRDVAVLAQSGDGRTLARVEATLPAGADHAEAAIPLPPELRNTLARLVLEGPATAAGVTLLDERWRRRPVGLLSGASVTAETPLTGALFYLRRALAPYASCARATSRRCCRAISRC